MNSLFFENSWKNIIKFVKNNNLKILILLFLFTFYIFINAFLYVNQVSSNLQQSVFRLHVIANSNSYEDQNLKYIIRDNLISYMNSICSESSSKEETIEIVSNHISDFTDIANKTIKDNGFDYNAIIEIGNFKFPSKTYGDISFPSGYYDALKVKIGKAKR